MSLDKRTKERVIEEFAKHSSDKGSTEVQIALLTERIRGLEKHFTMHKKDTNSKRGFLTLIGRRKRLLKYIKKTDEAKYQELLKRLKLRR